jgi:mRNA interferase MazF
LVLTRNEVLEVRSLVTVAEITSTMRGLAAEVPIDNELTGLDQESAINCDGLHTVPQSLLTKHVGAIDKKHLQRVCAAIDYALGC